MAPLYGKNNWSKRTLK